MMTDKESFWLLVLLLCAAIQGGLYFSDGTYFPADDTYFHLARIEGIAEGLRDGVFPVWINGFLLNGYGVPEGIMYPDTLLYLPGILRLTGMSLSGAYSVYWLVITFLGMYSCYFAYNRWLGSPCGGCAAAVLYSSCYFLLWNHGISAGLSAAMAFLPLTVFGMWSVLKGRWQYWYLGTAGLCIVCQSHLISLLLLLPVAACLLVMYGRNLSQPVRCRGFFKLLFFSLLLNLWRLVPLLDFYPRMQFHISDTQHYFGGNLSSLHYMTFSLDEMLHNGFMWGWPLILMMLVVLCGSCCGYAGGGYGIRGWHGTLLLCSVITLGMWQGFPWQLLESLPVLGTFLPKFQFPMRFISLGLVPLVYYLAGYAAALAEKWQQCRWLLAAACIAAACLSLYLNAAMELAIRGDYFPKSRGYACIEALPSTGAYNYEDYLYADVSFDRLRNRDGSRRTGADLYTEAEVVSFARQGSRLELAYCSEYDTAVELPLFFFEGYRGELEDGSSAVIGETAEHIMTVMLPAGEHYLSVWYEGQWYYGTACQLSFFGTLLFALCVFRRYLGEG